MSDERDWLKEARVTVAGQQRNVSGEASPWSKHVRFTQLITTEPGAAPPKKGEDA